MNDDKKRERVRQLDTAVLRRILDNLASPEDKPASREHPLGGLVHIDGIGHVPVPLLRATLADRTA